MNQENINQENINQENIVTDLMNRLRDQLRNAIPSHTLDAAMDQARRALHQGLADFDLVSRQELDAHLKTLAQLQQTVERLERRIGELESQ
jgi:BMFP domain-containing protein YqiC